MERTQWRKLVHSEENGREVQFVPQAMKICEISLYCNNKSPFILELFLKEPVFFANKEFLTRIWNMKHFGEDLMLELNL